jgi:hypothetical protein
VSVACISRNPPASLADAADKAGKIQRPDLAQPQKLWFFEARSAKKTAKNSGQ